MVSSRKRQKTGKKHKVWICKTMLLYREDMKKEKARSIPAVVSHLLSNNLLY